VGKRSRREEVLHKLFGGEEERWGGGVRVRAMQEEMGRGPDPTDGHGQALRATARIGEARVANKWAPT
jgi:hypothetical protein